MTTVADLIDVSRMGHGPESQQPLSCRPRIAHGGRESPATLRTLRVVPS